MQRRAADRTVQVDECLGGELWSLRPYKRPAQICVSLLATRPSTSGRFSVRQGQLQCGERRCRRRLETALTSVFGKSAAPPRQR
jgi:hypothetical protein